jgi:hypothetical protein
MIETKVIETLADLNDFLCQEADDHASRTASAMLLDDDAKVFVAIQLRQTFIRAVSLYRAGMQRLKANPPLPWTPLPEISVVPGISNELTRTPCETIPPALVPDKDSAWLALTSQHHVGP